MTAPAPCSCDQALALTAERDTLAARVRELEGERDRLRGVVEAVQGLLEASIDALIWCSGSADFAPEGKAHEGWLKACAPVIKQWSTLRDRARSLQDGAGKGGG